MVGGPKRLRVLPSFHHLVFMEGPRHRVSFHHHLGCRTEDMAHHQVRLELHQCGILEHHHHGTPEDHHHLGIQEVHLLHGPIHHLGIQGDLLHIGVHICPRQECMARQECMVLHLAQVRDHCLLCPLLLVGLHQETCLLECDRHLRQFQAASTSNDHQHPVLREHHRARHQQMEHLSLVHLVKGESLLVQTLPLHHLLREMSTVGKHHLQEFHNQDRPCLERVHHRVDLRWCHHLVRRWCHHLVEKEMEKATFHLSCRRLVLREMERVTLALHHQA